MIVLEADGLFFNDIFIVDETSGKPVSGAKTTVELATEEGRSN